jgi:hypothetical protein
MPTSESCVEDPSWIPEGYIHIRGPDARRYVVPEFFVPTLHQNLDAYQKKDKLDVDKAAGTVSLIPFYFQRTA